ncbi:hypothetical protein SAMN04487906_0600 [Zhouia amylolytica]|uniref:Uncharacterized protein n=1 Tax=Zhouia amylolytica TaxID=376730 RepID=A0A1I6QDA4_9FLAO|nr:hypothetical protein [Zhouia amylolytica]SFS50461.1 hypothetical protein SAMN04487906_0600 [Zhouia amylolytica]
MAQDLRDLFKNNESFKPHKMPENHEKRFMGMLDEQLPKKKRNSTYLFLKIAASLLLLLSLGTIFYDSSDTVASQVVDVPEKSDNTNDKITLGDISPDLKKIENYYIANINVELAEVEITEENQQLFDGYMNRLEELNSEYQKLTEELNEVGPNEQTVSALIDNLQLRLQLLYRLKDKLEELKQAKNEKFNDQQV